MKSPEIKQLGLDALNISALLDQIKDNKLISQDIYNTIEAALISGIVDQAKALQGKTK